MQLNIGEIVQLKKQHPCGGNTWEIIRIGADFKIKCTTCEHLLMITRQNLEKNIKNKKHNTSKDKTLGHCPKPRKGLVP